MLEVTDALGREVRLPRPPARVVSLVPSETESVAALAGLERLAGRTSFCEEPRGAIEQIPSVGGTKKVDVDAVLALKPDLVLANQEENGRRDVERIMAAGVPVHVSFPRSVRESLSYLRSLATLLGLEHAPPEWPAPTAETRVPVFVPIWKDPWMTFDGRTYANDLLASAGAANVFADWPRRFPLAADLGEVEALPAGDRDTRYPRTGEAEIVGRSPALILLPDEPYAFGEADADEIRGWPLSAAVELVSGKDLFWYGVRTIGASTRLRALVDRHRSR